jgi:hypothetical protein
VEGLVPANNKDGNFVTYVPFYHERTGEWVTSHGDDFEVLPTFDHETDCQRLIDGCAEWLNVWRDIDWGNE